MFWIVRKAVGLVALAVVVAFSCFYYHQIHDGAVRAYHRIVGGSR